MMRTRRWLRVLMLVAVLGALTGGLRAYPGSLSLSPHSMVTVRVERWPLHRDVRFERDPAVRVAEVAGERAEGSLVSAAASRSACADSSHCRCDAGDLPGLAGGAVCAGACTGFGGWRTRPCALQEATLQRHSSRPPPASV